MSVVAITVFVIAYLLIASDRVNKTMVALCGAAVLAALGIVESEDVFFSRETGIDWDVIFLLFGMMVIVSVLRQTGVFEYIAIWAAKRAKGSPLRIMILLVVGDRDRVGAAGQRHHSVAHRPGDIVGVRPARASAPRRF